MAGPISYRSAGVDIAAADELLDGLGERLRSTYTPLVLAGLGGFGGAMRLPPGMSDPALVLSIDSVGTKIAVAARFGRLDSIGADLVNHCANDVLAMGARPLAFLDYIAHSDLPNSDLEAAIGGVADACRAHSVPLVGGETAQLPGIYRSGQLDLVGAMVGVAETGQLLSPDNVLAGDFLIGLPSNGIHTNGYSLVQRALEGLDLAEHNPEVGRPLADEMLAVHRSYVGELAPFLDRVHGLAHITGGGICANTARIIPPGLSARFGWGAWQVPPIFHLIQRRARIGFEELARVFNLGLGMVVIGGRDLADDLVRAIPGSTLVGQVVEASGPRAEILR